MEETTYDVGRVLELMNFDWQKFLLSEFKGKIVKSPRGEEYNIDCIADNCPNPKGHMFVNLHSTDKHRDKAFICHRCNVGGNWKAFLILHYKRPLAEILSFINESYLIERSPYVSALENIKELDTNISIGKIKNEPIIIDIPHGSKLLKHSNRFTERRKIPENIFKKFKFHICTQGFYKNRIIIPVETEKDRAFIAYSQMSKEALKIAKELSQKHPESRGLDSKRKKIKNPFGSIFSRMLFNYNNIPYGCKLLFAHEGSTDVIRTTIYNHYAIGLFHSTISEDQAVLIAEKEPSEVCIMLDADVKLSKIIKCVEILKEWYDGKITYVKLKEGDPDDINSKKRFERIVSKRTKVTKMKDVNSLKLFN